MRTTSEEVVALTGAGALISAGVLAATGGLLALAGLDEVIRFHGVLFLIAGGGAALYIMTNPRLGGPREEADYMDGPIKLATLAAVFWGVVGFLVGDIIAWQLAFPALMKRHFGMPLENGKIVGEMVTGTTIDATSATPARNRIFR